MPTISKQEKAKAQEFCALMDGLMDIIDDIATKIPEGDYLKLCSKLKDLHGFKDNISIRELVNQNEVVAAQARRARLRERPPPRVLTDAQKLASGHYRVCEFCDKIISKSWYRGHIAETEYCSIARDAKKLATATGKQDNAKEVEAIAKIKRALHVRRANQ